MGGMKFQKGQSGNPFGRPRRRQPYGERLARSLALTLARERPEVPLPEHLWTARALVESLPGARWRTGLGRLNWRDRHQRPPPAWLISPPFPIVPSAPRRTRSRR
jgi:hypothetical protein